MRIKEIEFNNFRIYHDKNLILFDLNSGKNISIISGKNGYGKTTFLMGLVWCLYGRQMVKVDQLYKKEISDNGGYAKYIGRSLNRKAERNGVSKFSVSITFEEVDIPEVTCNQVKVSREYSVSGNHTEQVNITIDGRKNELIDDLSRNNQNGEEIFIRDIILPLEIAKFFFFDAEKIVALAEINSLEERKDLSLAYSEVLGIKKYEDLKVNLENYRDKIRQNCAKPAEKRELQEIKGKINGRIEDLQGFKQEIEELEEEKVEKGHGSNEIQKKLIRDGNKLTLEELQELKDQRLSLESEQQKLKEELRNLFDLIPFAFSGELLLEVSEQIAQERVQKENQYSKDEAGEKINAILTEIDRARIEQGIHPDDYGIVEFYSKNIRRSIQKYFFPSTNIENSNFKPLHDFSDSQANELQTLLATLRHSFKTNFEGLSRRNSQLKASLDQIKRRIRDAEKDAEDSYIANLRREKDMLDNRILAIDGEINAIYSKIGEYEGQVKSLKQKQEGLNKKITLSKDLEVKDQVTKRVISKISAFISRLKDDKKMALEQKIKQGANELMHKTDFIDKVIVDISSNGQDVDISLFDGNGKKIEKSSLSMGERQIYASSLLKALVEESDIKFPVFIDSPMQKFDEEHAEKIINFFYPKVSEQVVIFPLINKELTKKEYELLKKEISKSYLIENVENDKSRFLEVQPGELITKYEELYNAN